jgi:hypothetical protein
MPSSYSSNISIIVSIIKEVNPRTVLDIGSGWGKYGLLCREYLQNLERLDGVEVWEPYVSDIQRAIYSSLIIGDIRDISLPHYELTLLVDVLEHFEKEEGKELLRRFPKPLLVSTPTEFFQEDDPNPYERHRSLWHIADFADYVIEDYSNEKSYILLVN